MRLLLIGCGGVGEIIARVLTERSQNSDWLEALIVTDYDASKVDQTLKQIEGKGLEVKGIVLDASNQDAIVATLKEHRCDCLFDASPPYLANVLFDAAYEAKVHFLNMGTWSVPDTEIKDVKDAKKAYKEFMTDYNFNRDAQWRDIDKTALICVGIDPGVVNVFAKFAAKHLFDKITEIHVKDGCNISSVNNADEISFGFNVWTVLDECLNTSVIWTKEEGFIGHPAFSGEETFDFPEEVGPLKLYQIEHEEVVLIPKYLEKYGLEKCTYKIALDDGLIGALKVIEQLGLRSLEEREINGMLIKPRDMIAALLPQPNEINQDHLGKMCVGIHCKGLKDGLSREVFIYQTYDQQTAWERYQSQAIVTQTAIGAAIATELVGTGRWRQAGVNGPEAFDPEAFIELMDQYDYAYNMIEMNSAYNRAQGTNIMRHHCDTPAM